VVKLFRELGPRYRERPGGYLRMLKCGFRPGDWAPMAFVELVDRRARTGGTEGAGRAGPNPDGGSGADTMAGRLCRREAKAATGPAAVPGRGPTAAAQA